MLEPKEKLGAELEAAGVAADPNIPVDDCWTLAPKTLLPLSLGAAPPNPLAAPFPKLKAEAGDGGADLVEGVDEG